MEILPVELQNYSLQLDFCRQLFRVQLKGSEKCFLFRILFAKLNLRKLISKEQKQKKLENSKQVWCWYCLYSLSLPDDYLGHR